jgi:glycosyltransferase involved in cell wall biosynthesis
MTEIKNLGNEVIFCATNDDYTVKLQELGFRYIPIALERKGMNILKDLSLFFSLMKIYRKESPDWIFHNSIKPNIYGAIAAHFTGRHCINTVSGLGHMFMKRNFLNRIAMILYRFAGFCSRKTFFQNKDDMQYFLDNNLITREKCLLVAGSGVNTEYFKPGVYMRNQSLENKFIFLYLGRILWDKGINELIQSVRILKKRYHLLVVNFLGMIDTGNPAGISKFQVQEWVDEGLINYLGEKADVRPDLEDCDCVILPSYREGTPRSLLEASAMELPVIASDVAGCKDVVENGVTGFLAKAKDWQALAGAMEEMIKMTESQRKQMGKNGRAKIIREYSESAVIKAYCSQIGIN